jgi:RNA polymerase sigma-70 factor (ECF subfamily)
MDSSDLVQETLLRAHQHREQFHGSSEGERIRWLQRILQRVARDRFAEESAQKRDFRREGSLDDLLAKSSARLEEILASQAAAPGEDLEEQEILVRLFQAIGSLPDDQQDAVVLRYLLELPVAEIAERLGRSERAVAGLLFRGLSALRDWRHYLTGCVEKEEA